MKEDIHQSTTYSLFMRKIGWLVEEIDGIKIYIKKFPLLDATIKIQRTDTLPDREKLKSLMKKYSTRAISFEPSEKFQISSAKPADQILQSPYLPTKTIHIDLKSSEETIFKRLSPAKQRGIRRAQKGGVIIKQGAIADFISLKNKSAGVLGFMTTTTLKPLWEVFSPHNAFVLIATCNQKSEAGILLLIHQQTCYYWMAAATYVGKKSFAPTLLVWEALKLAKQKGCTLFDFEGIYDERYPGINKNWLGFTKFKQGFGGIELEYPQPIRIT